MVFANILLCSTLYLVATSYMVYGKKDDNGKVDFIQERQLISQLSRWIFGRQEPKNNTETKVKYLPIYVPVPVYPDGRTRPQADYYGALHQKKILEQQSTGTGDVVIEVPNQGHRYGFTFRGDSNYGQRQQLFNRQSIPHYLMQFGDQFAPGNDAYFQHYPSQTNGAYQYTFDNNYGYGSDEERETNDFDSVVIENPELNTNPDGNRDTGLYLRKRRRYKKRT